MTAEEIIENLQRLIEHGLKPTAIIKSWDGESGEWQPVTGFLYDLDSVELQTDDRDEESPVAPSPAQGTPELPQIDVMEVLQDIADAIEALKQGWPAADVIAILQECIDSLALAGPQNGQGWVRVEDGLPACGTVSIVYCVGEDGLPWQDLASYSYHGGWSEKDIEHANKVVTHWQLLPAPPIGDVPQKENP